MTNEQKNTTSPEVLMLMGTQCTYCGPMMQMLMEFMKLGQIAELRLVNIENAPELASELGAVSYTHLRAHET